MQKRKKVGNDPQETILECLEEDKVTQTAMAEKLGTDRRNLNQKLRRTADIKAKEFVRMSQALGYEVELVKETSE